MRTDSYLVAQNSPLDKNSGSKTCPSRCYSSKEQELFAFCSFPAFRSFGHQRKESHQSQDSFPFLVASKCVFLSIGLLDWLVLFLLPAGFSPQMSCPLVSLCGLHVGSQPGACLRSLTEHCLACFSVRSSTLKLPCESVGVETAHIALT